VITIKELRCSNPECGRNGKKSRMLAQGRLVAGTIIEIKCTRCGTVTGFQAVPNESNVEE